MFDTVIKAQYIENLMDRLIDITDSGIISASPILKSLGPENIDLIIPRSINDIEVKEIATDGFMRAIAIRSVDIQAQIDSIPKYAFKYCISMTSITLPPTLTEINYQSFGYCRMLREISIPESVTQIASQAFTSCDMLGVIFMNVPEGYVQGAPWGASYGTAVEWRR